MTCWSTKGWVGRASLCCSHTHHWKHNSYENGQSWSENFCWEETIQHMLLGKKWRREGGHHTIDFGLPLPDACKRQPLMEKSWPFCQFWWEPNPWNSYYEGAVRILLMDHSECKLLNPKLWPKMRKTQTLACFWWPQVWDTYRYESGIRVSSNPFTSVNLFLIPTMQVRKNELTKVPFHKMVAQQPRTWVAALDLLKNSWMRDTRYKHEDIDYW